MTLVALMVRKSGGKRYHFRRHGFRYKYILTETDRIITCTYPGDRRNCPDLSVSMPMMLKNGHAYDILVELYRNL